MDNGQLRKVWVTARKNEAANLRPMYVLIRTIVANGGNACFVVVLCFWAVLDGGGGEAAAAAGG